MPVEDYQTSLTDEQKNILDDAPPEVIVFLLEQVRKTGYPPYFKLRVRDKLTGKTTGLIEFEGPEAVNGVDYLKYLVRRGYKVLPNAS